MGNRGARQNQAYGAGDPYLNQYGAGYYPPGQTGLASYGAPAYTITTPPNYIQEPWAVTQWTEYYVPTVGGRQKRPVIYIAAPLPAANPCAGIGGFGGGFGGLPLGGGFGGLPMGGGLGGGFGGGLGGGFPLGGGFGGGLPVGGGYGANLGYQVLPMVTVGYGGGIPGVGGGYGGLGGLGGLGGGYGGGLGGLGGGYGGGLGGLGGGGYGGGYGRGLGGGGGLPLF